ncbi:phenylacetate--CoA ligase family protein [Melghirimyces algeriensis]|nr:AMP-binding protein [Melghirimyces algeriensis]
MPRPELEALQTKRLKRMVERIYSLVPFYRRKLDAAGIKPQDILGMEDLLKLPFTRKSDLREQYPFRMFAVEQEEVARIHGSSGTSGKPTVVGYTRKDIQRWAELCARSIVMAGGRPGDVFHNAYGYGLFTGGLGLHYGAERLGATVVPVSGGNRSRQVTLIQDFLPRGIGGTPSFILSLAEMMEDMGLKPWTTSLEYGIFGAEPWSEEMRQTLEEKWGIDALDIYGLSEVIGPGVAMECREAKDGLHIAEDHFLPEVIHPQTGEPLPDGEYGELVFTSLTKEALPILRYRTGDITALHREVCRCGRTHTRMSRIKGRIDDMLIIRGVNVFPSELEAVLLNFEELAPHYQLVVTREKSIDQLTLEVEVSEAWFRSIESSFGQGNERVVQLCKRLQSVVKDTLYVTTKVILKEPKSLPRSEGKAVRVIDQR